MIIFNITVVVCEISSPMRVTSFSADSAYSFSGACDHWLVTPTATITDLTFSVAVNFVEEDLMIGRVTVRYGNLELVSTDGGDAESNVEALSSEETTEGIIFTFSNNVVATTGDGFNLVELGDISVTVRHTYAPVGAEGIEIVFGDVSSVPTAVGLCGSVEGVLVFGDGSNQVADPSNLERLQQFSSSWLLPPSLQTSTIEACSKQWAKCGS